MDLDVSAQVHKTHRWTHLPLLLPPPLAFVVSPPPDAQVHAIVANAVVSTAVDKRRRKLVGTSIQIKKDCGCDNLTDAARPLGVKTP